jgi:hypothetical protein
MEKNREEQLELLDCLAGSLRRLRKGVACRIGEVHRRQSYSYLADCTHCMKKIETLNFQTTLKKWDVTVKTFPPYIYLKATTD